MGILDRAAERLGELILTAAQKIQPVKQPFASWLSAQADEDSMTPPSLTSAKAQQNLYKRLSWVSTAVSHVARQVALTKFNVETIEGEKTVSIENHDFELLLANPNPAESRLELIERTVSNIKLTGNGYWWMNRANENAPPDEIWNINPSQMQPIPDGNMYIRGYEYFVGGETKILMPWEVAHFKLYNPDTRYYGQSQISQIAQVALGDLGMQAHNTRFFTTSNAMTDPILAFADPIMDSDWEKMKRDVIDAKKLRRQLMLRGTGEGGVSFIQSRMSQKDMEFLAGRNFNKEEIWSWLAPGLSSMLAINATEANSKTGKITFMDLAVHPMNVQIAQKITNDILPIYGDNLTGSFQDVRIPDTALKLAEQNTYSLTHTVNEVREKFYNDELLADERGELFPSQIGQTSSVIDLDSFDTTPDEDTMAKLDKLMEGQKESERKQYKNYVKARKSGDGFEFYYLDEDEQSVLKADIMGVDQVINLIDELREVV